MSESHARLATDSEGLLGHHFDDLAQQHEANRLGMWIFLATEIMFFGAVFVAYTVYRFNYPDAFAAGSRLLDVVLGTINTGVLLLSSLTMALAVYSAETGRRKLLVAFLLITMLLGLTFLGIKGLEYYHKYQEQLIPLAGLPFAYEGAAPEQVALFLSLYLTMTGIHALHLLIGIGALAVFIFLAWRGHFTRGDYVPVELLGLYWHFVDIVWVFLFPLLYLVDRT